MFERWRNLSHQAFGERWNAENYRRANHFGAYDPAGNTHGARLALRDAMEYLAEYGHTLDAEAFEAARDCFKVASADGDLAQT